MFESIITFPFVQIADGLRYLSLSGAAGNIVAVALYIALCLIPLMFFVFQWTKHRLTYTDALLPVVTILMFIILYQLINPGLITNAAATKALPCTTLYSVIFTYLILTLIKLFQDKAIKKLCKYFNFLLWAVNIMLACSAVFTVTVAFAQSIKDLQAANSGNTDLLGLTYVFMFFGMLADVIPLVSGIVVVFFGMRLVSYFGADRYSEKTVLSANRLSCACKTALAVTVLSTMVFNVLQYAFASQLHQINGNINIPILSIVFVLAVFLFSQIISEGKALKDDNDSII
ncbi:MAG: hypothetical protein RSD35_03545 [Oscillospiraceae bacterium]